jgi:hypothetical protein
MHIFSRFLTGILGMLMQAPPIDTGGGATQSKKLTKDDIAGSVQPPMRQRASGGKSGIRRQFTRRDGDQWHDKSAGVAHDPFGDPRDIDWGA